jgi:hypothetical protein
MRASPVPVVGISLHDSAAHASFSRRRFRTRGIGNNAKITSRPKFAIAAKVAQLINHADGSHWSGGQHRDIGFGVTTAKLAWGRSKATSEIGVEIARLDAADPGCKRR